jgi:hypothetical protein
LGTQSEQYSIDELDHVVAEATRLYDEEDYSGARDLFLAAAMLAPPTELVVTLLADTFKREKRQVLHTLVARYPTSRSVAIGVAEALVDDTFSHFAARLCAQLLQNGGLSLTEELEMRWIRFRAVARSRINNDPSFFAPLVEDLTILWNSLAATNSSGVPFNRHSLLGVLSGIIHPPVIPVLHQLRDQVHVMKLSSQVEQLLSCKIVELEMLARMKGKDP